MFQPFMHGVQLYQLAISPDYRLRLASGVQVYSTFLARALSDRCLADVNVPRIDDSVEISGS